MIELMYVSRAQQRFTEQQLTELLAISRRNNTLNNITGLLLYDGFGSFIQVIEGDESEVERLFKHIKNDSRHTNINRIACQPISQRGFPEWQMGFKRLSDDNIAGLEGFSQFMQAEQKFEHLSYEQSFAIKMLRYFRDSQ